MDLLAKFEQTLEGIFEGVFSRAFKAPLQPVEVAKRLTREMENHRTVSVNSTYVPNFYTVELSSEAYQAFHSISGPLLVELEQYMRDFTAQHHYQVVGPISVKLAENVDLKGHDFTILAANLEDSPNVQTAKELGVLSGEAQGQHFILTDGLTIGRGPSNVLALSEPDVSRSHAEIVLQDEVWVLRDLGSTNGTFLNEKRIVAHALTPGDSIRIGHTVIAVI